MLSAVVKKRLSFIINIAYFALIFACFYLVFKTFFGALVPFVTAFLVAAVLNRPVRFIEKRTPLKRNILSPVFVVAVLALIIALFSLVGMGVFSKVKGFYEYITSSLQNITGIAADIRDWLLGAISFLPSKMRLSATDSITAFFNDIIENGFSNISIGSIGIDWGSVLTKGGDVIKDTVTQIPSVAVGVLITIVASVFMLTDYENILKFISRQFPDNKVDKFNSARTLASSTLKKMLKAYTIIILITMTELCIGLYILKFCGIFESDYIVLIALIIAIIDIIPVLGTGTVLIPWAVYCFVTGDAAMGVGLVVIYAVIMVVRQIIEPKLVAGQAGLSPIVTIIAMYIGTKALGVLGFFILPFVVILIKKFNDEGIIHLFNSGNDDKAGKESNVEEIPVAEASENEENP